LTAKECIPVLEASLTKSGNKDLSMNDEFKSVTTMMIPLFVYLDVTLQSDQDKDLAQSIDDSGAKSFSVKGTDGDTVYNLDLEGHPLATWYSQKTKKLTGYWEIYNMRGGYKWSARVPLRTYQSIADSSSILSHSACAPLEGQLDH
jgi:hypothetical protein